MDTEKLSFSANSIENQGVLSDPALHLLEKTSQTAQKAFIAFFNRLGLPEDSSESTLNTKITIEDIDYPAEYDPIADKICVGIDTLEEYSEYTDKKADIAAGNFTKDLIHEYIHKHRSFIYLEPNEEALEESLTEAFAQTILISYRHPEKSLEDILETINKHSDWAPNEEDDTYIGIAAKFLQKSGTDTIFQFLTTPSAEFYDDNFKKQFLGHYDEFAKSIKYLYDIELPERPTQDPNEPPKIALATDIISQIKNERQ